MGMCADITRSPFPHAYKYFLHKIKDTPESTTYITLLLCDGCVCLFTSPPIPMSSSGEFFLLLFDPLKLCRRQIACLTSGNFMLDVRELSC